MLTLNTFLRGLPELAVNGMTFSRKYTNSDYYLNDGCYKFRKVGYNLYAVSKRIGVSYQSVSEWDSSQYAGDVSIIKIHLSLTGVIVTLGEDIPEG